MLTNPDERQITAIASLRGDPDWQVVMEWLQDSMKTLMHDMCETQDNAILRQQQGAAQVLTFVLDLNEGAGDIAHRMRQKQT
jgi:lipase chaperone LimK